MTSPFWHNINAIQYTGSNSADVITAGETFFDLVNQGINFVSGAEVMGVVEIVTDAYTLYVNNSDWLVQDQSGINVLTNAYFSVYYQTPTEIPTPTHSLGYASVPSLLTTQQTTVSVALTPSLPSSAYNASAALTGNAQLLGDLAINSVTVAGAAQVDVVVQNNGLLTLSGATVLVTALHNG